MNVKEKIETLVEEFNTIVTEIQEREARQREIKGAVEALNEMLQAESAVAEAVDEDSDWVKLEHEVQQILTDQELHGWFDERAAWELTSSLQTELEETYKVLRNKHPFVSGPEFTPRRNNRTQGYVEGATFYSACRN